jgi:hypothetical protein
MRQWLLASVVAGLCLPGLTADSFGAESASGAYLLGLRGQGAGLTPPPGIYFSNQTLFYDASTGANISLGGGEIGVNVEAAPIVDIPTLLWVTPAEVLGGNLGLTATVPFGKFAIDATVGPLNVSDSVFTVGDPSVGAFVGWHSGLMHLQSGVTAFIPIGDYREDAVANVAKHRLAADFYGALTIFDPESGVDLTNIVGVTVNAENQVTDYRTGTELHWEGSLTKKFTDNFSAGVVGYYYNQLTGDSGAGATLGDFKGEIAAIGVTAGLDFVIGQTPVSARIRYYHEFHATNRLEGDAVFLSTSLPLSITK